MEQRIVRFFGTAAQHILHAMRRAFLAVFLTFILVFIAGAAITEVVAALLTKEFPTGLTHLAAAAIGIAFGYGAAVTVAISEILIALVRTIELLVKESEKVAEEAIKEAEVLARKAETGALHLGQGALGDAESFGRGAAGLVGSIAGAVGHDVSAVEHGVAAHLPGHHENG